MSELLEKLLRTGHLSVPERRALGAVTLEAMCAGIARALPFPEPESDVEQVVIVKAGEGFAVRARHEVGVGRLGPTIETVHATIEAAVEAWLAAKGWESAIDGIVIER